MENAKDMDLRDMLDLTAMKLREYESEAGTKQSFGYEVKFQFTKIPTCKRNIFHFFRSDIFTKSCILTLVSFLMAME